MKEKETWQPSKFQSQGAFLNTKNLCDIIVSIIRAYIKVLRGFDSSKLIISSQYEEIIVKQWHLRYGSCDKKGFIDFRRKKGWSWFTVCINSCSSTLFLAESKIDLLHFLDPLLEFSFILCQTHLNFKCFHDFTYVFELVEHLLMMTAALGRGPRAYKGRQFVIELHLPNQKIDITSFFSLMSSIFCEYRRKWHRKGFLQVPRSQRWRCHLLCLYSYPVDERIDSFASILIYYIKQVPQLSNQQRSIAQNINHSIHNSFSPLSTKDYLF